MSPDHPFTPELKVLPLTFLQIYRSADVLMAALAAQETGTQSRLSSPRALRGLIRRIGLSLYYHWLTSGYGAYAGERAVGYLYLRGWEQILYVETLVVRPEWQDRGVESTLLRFAEEQARQLSRKWLGLTANPGLSGSVELYEAEGYRRGHWHVLRHEGRLALPSSSSRGEVQLRRLGGLAGRRLCHRLARREQLAGEASGDERLAGFLAHDPYCGSGKYWLLSSGGGGQPIACFNQRSRSSCFTLYVACDPDWWAAPPVLDGLMRLLSQQGDEASIVDVRTGSNEHHEALRPELERLGFVERPAAAIRMFKRLGET